MTKETSPAEMFGCTQGHPQSNYPPLPPTGFLRVALGVLTCSVHEAGLEPTEMLLPLPGIKDVHHHQLAAASFFWSSPPPPTA